MAFRMVIATAFIVLLVAGEVGVRTCVHRTTTAKNPACNAVPGPKSTAALLFVTITTFWGVRRRMPISTEL